MNPYFTLSTAINSLNAFKGTYEGRFENFYFNHVPSHPTYSTYNLDNGSSYYSGFHNMHSLFVGENNAIHRSI